MLNKQLTQESVSREFSARPSETISEEAQLREIDERHFLAQQIFFRRASRHWLQDELAKASGLTQAQVAMLEAGQANPTLRTLAKFATALSCTVSDLLHLFRCSVRHFESRWWPDWSTSAIIFH